MAKYNNVREDIEGVFGTSEWTTHNITAIPSNWVGELQGVTEFVRINIIPGQTNFGYSQFGVNGLIRLDVFVPVGGGETRALEICDILDSLFQGKTFTNGTQTFASTATSSGVDPDNASFHRVNWSTSFNYNA